MVELSEIARLAVSHDTVVALAFRRALGITRPGPGTGRSPGRGRPSAPDARYARMHWCFENHGSPMDRS